MLAKAEDIAVGLGEEENTRRRKLGGLVRIYLYV